MQKIWNFLASVKLSFFLLLILAAMSILGTVIPQNEHASIYIKHFGQANGGLILALGLDDMYHSSWFLALMAALGANLVVCSLDRLPKTLKIIKKDPKDEVKRNRKPDDSLIIEAGATETAQKAASLLKKRLGDVTHDTRPEDQARLLFSQKGAWSRFGVYGVHFSILIIFAGAVVGSIWGFSGRVNISRDSTISSISLKNGAPHKLGFSVRLDHAQTTYYEKHKGMPSEYRADITFLQNKKEAAKAVLKVNHPAEFEGVVFYLSTIGESPKKLLAKIVRNGKAQEVTLLHRRWTDLPGGGKAGVMEFRKHIHMGEAYSGPFARIAYLPGNDQKPIVMPAFKGKVMPSKEPVQFEIVQAITVPYCGFSVKYDPGVWFIWVGCTLMVLGFLATFYSSHKKIWIRVIPQEGNACQVEVCHSANKNKVGIKKLAQKLVQDLK
jgi:cytochrome c biogenesis protein